MDHRTADGPAPSKPRAVLRPDRVERARDGDVAAFEELYREHVGSIYALCLRLAGDASRAEELTQDTFVRAWEKLPTFRGDSAFTTWLHRLAVNLVLGERRSLLRWKARFEPSDAEGAPAEPEPTTATGLDLERAIAELPPQARAVFVLYEVEGYAHREIARLCSLSEATCRSHLHRARQLLRKALR